MNFGGVDEHVEQRGIFLEKAIDTLKNETIAIMD